MASNFADRVSYFLALPAEHKDALGAIRHWDNLKIGVEEETVWVKDFTPLQIESLEVKTLPQRRLYYTNGPSLYKIGSLLPDRAVPPLLWTAIERELPLKLPAFNHNYFGIKETVPFGLQKTGNEQEGFACLTAIDTLRAYMISAPAVRLQQVQWTIVNGKALLLGAPLLPVPGEVFWRDNGFLVPAGYELAQPLLSEIVRAVLIPQKDCWVLWQPGSRYCTIPKEDFQSLTIASFRNSTKA